MPLYFTDIESSLGFTRDEEGAEYLDAEAALAEAKHAALEYAADRLKHFQPVARHTTIVRDASGAEIGRFDARDVIHEVARKGLERD